MQREPASRSPLPALLTGIGGLVTVLAALAPWHALSVQPSFLSGITQGPLFTQNIAGTQGTDGKIAVAGGIVLIVAAVVMWLSPSERVHRAMAVGAIVVAGVVAAIILVDIVGGKSIFKSFFRSSVRSFADKYSGGLLAPSNGQIDELRNLLGITLSIQAGIIVAFIASVVALAGGVLGVTSKRRPAVSAGPSTSEQP
ncbi:MAG: hypothetical protein JOZ04_11830 [Acidimicrobiia bacterium]|nr:hypothetical protein [Acidimicrobiia bacterium]